MRQKKKDLNEIHCINCGRFLGYQLIMLGIVELKCPKCKEWTTISNFPEVDNGQDSGYTEDKVDKVAKA